MDKQYEGMTTEELREQIFLILFRRTKKIAEQSDTNAEIEERIAKNIILLGEMVDKLEESLEPQV